MGNSTLGKGLDVEMGTSLIMLNISLIPQEEGNKEDRGQRTEDGGRNWEIGGFRDLGIEGLGKTEDG